MIKTFLIAYYSHSGNTRTIADLIQNMTGGDLFEILPKQPYPENYNKCTEQAKREINSGYKPELQKSVPNIETYDIVFIGSPNWWGTIAPPVATFLSGCDLSGKIVIPFCTHGGGGQGRCFADVAKLTPKSNHREGVVISGNRVNSAQPELEKWLQNIKAINEI
ncbi:MAG: NAD(P)H-dependent oxidoreductase [Planctomycetaceae bacterium]|jgi:flavodoxin|nr:NAD(P)H-dependent oxidoreductase [Planctomycetaceae bacterium]